MSTWQRKPAVAHPSSLACPPHTNVAIARGHGVGLWRQGISGAETDLRRQIFGDGEHLGRRIPRPGACCHLRVSPCSELTFLFYRLLVRLVAPAPPPSPQTCVYGNDARWRGMEGLFPSTNGICSLAVHTPLNCPSSAVSQTWDAAESVCDAASLPRENSEPDELPVARPGASLLESRGQRGSAVPREGGLT